MIFGKLGRRWPDEAQLGAAMKLHRDVLDLSRIPASPAAFDWAERPDRSFTPYPLFRNGDLGTCVIASLGHDALTESGQTGSALQVSDEEILSAYRLFGGYVDGDPSTDRGCVMLDVARRMLAGEQIGPLRLTGFVALDPRKPDLLHAASNLFGGLWLGWDLPKAWENAETWDVSPTGSTSDDWAPRSLGGHATHAPARSPSHHGLVTWTQAVPYTPAAEWVYCREAYALLWERHWAILMGDRCPAGVDVQQLMDSMAVLRQGFTA